METSEQRNKRFRDMEENIATKLLEKYPEVTLDRKKHGIDVIYYIPSFLDEIRVDKSRRGINTKIFSLDPYFLTEKAARAAISEHLTAAKQKFENCLQAVNKIKEDLNFDISYCVEGDTHGISDYPYISFEMGGFNFTFTIDQ